MKETVSEIRLFGDPILRKKTQPVEQPGQKEREILTKMSRLMYEAGGIGLSANQAGYNLCMAVVDVGEGLYKLINPRIVKKRGSQISEEGCLSLPGTCVKVKRAREVQVQAIDENAKPITIMAEGLFACCLQHEIDHLNGKMIIDYASFLKRLSLKKALAKIKKQNNENLPESERKYQKL